MNEQKPTHAALSLPLYLAVMKTIAQMPWEQSNQLMVELQQCQQINLDSQQVTNDKPRLTPAGR